jgi:hypothetical protein
MSMYRWYLGRGDRLPAFAATVTDDMLKAVDLTGAVAYLALRNIDGSPILAGTARPGGWAEFPLTVANPVTGTVYYDWQQAATDALHAGVLNLAVRAVFADGTQITVPTRGEAELLVWD